MMMAYIVADIMSVILGCAMISSLKNMMIGRRLPSSENCIFSQELLTVSLSLSVSPFEISVPEFNWGEKNKKCRKMCKRGEREEVRKKDVKEELVVHASSSHSDRFFWSLSSSSLTSFGILLHFHSFFFSRLVNLLHSGYYGSIMLISLTPLFSQASTKRNKTSSSLSLSFYLFVILRSVEKRKIRRWENMSIHIIFSWTFWSCDLREWNSPHHLSLSTFCFRR